MRIIKFSALLGAAVAQLASPLPGLAQETAPTTSRAESATPQEVITKVREAAQFLHQKGSAGISEFNTPNSRWVWKDSYVFVYDCHQNKMLAHPIRPDLVGKPLLQIKDNNNKSIFEDLCKAGAKPTGGWVEYVWPKPGEGQLSRKISYALAADISFDYGTQVAAGIYDNNLKEQQLSELLNRMSDPKAYPMAQ